MFYPLIGRVLSFKLMYSIDFMPAYPYFPEPRIHAKEIAAVPMGLYYIGALLKSQGHHAEILNWHSAKTIL